MRKLKNEELNRISVDDFKSTNKTPIKIIIDNIRSAHNVGSIFRTSDAFLIKEIIICGITATPPSKEIRKTALDSTESVSWKYCDDIIKEIKKLKKEKYKIIAIEQADESENLNNFRPHKNDKYAIVFGNEVNGVDDKIIQVCDNVIEIPQFGTKHSLNVSISAGIILWDLYIKLYANLDH